ncbi:hypothetical protein GGR92_001495 [Spirosoma lacussanchae]|uniref:hypothetical protein n=1 Tax=Spirosoma lacussanchae TaxID=1884249 RepID=UPI001109ECBC|nr:hypothetical protein [Spirosoma lacussanchae]
MNTLIDHLTPGDGDTELIGSRIGRIDPENFRNQSGAAIDDDDDGDTEDAALTDDEPVDEDGDPTGEHDHHQDDNYALGGHVTRSGSV